MSTAFFHWLIIQETQRRGNLSAEDEGGNSFSLKSKSGKLDYFLSVDSPRQRVPSR